ncbi:methyltransferase domain-containing protein [Shimia sp. SDUM112013]|uniref:methyltransferase domain-containing protein n=1 Tax=Shimia sp. SDUM112013 TaxID=3136160 RepID=UPI0032EE8DF8
MASLNRIVMQKTSRKWLRELDLENMDLCEISGWWGQGLPSKSYQQFRYPKHDICAGPFMNRFGKIRQFDLILANQVWEHLDRPYIATVNVFDMLRPGGYFWVAVPFFIPFHAAPTDCSRWTARGLKNLLTEVGFAEEDIRAEQWGNRAAGLRNMEKDWPPAYDPDTDDLTNDPDFPICAWALARKT